jgi:hypothetical protein
VFRGEAESDKRDVRMLSRCHCSDLLHIDRVCDHFVPEPGDDLGKQGEPILSLVGDEDAEVVDSVLSHTPNVRALSAGLGRLPYAYHVNDTLRQRLLQRAVFVKHAVRGSKRSARNDPASTAWVWSSLSSPNEAAGDGALLEEVSRAMPVREPPIRVFLSHGYWRVDYGSYVDGFHTTRAEAIATATVAAAREDRTLEIEETD